MKRLSIVLAAGGLVLGTALIAWFGAGRVAEAVISVGWIGFAVLILVQMVLFLILGAAWDAIVPDKDARRPWVFLWGRMVRDAATNCLPFSQMGGFVLGARTVTLAGIAWPLATASTLVDVTAEFLAQVAFAAFGLVILLVRSPGHYLAPPLAIALLVSVAAGIAFILLQKGAAPIFARLGSRIAGEWFENAQSRVDLLQHELGVLYARPGHLALGCAIHLLGWVGTGIGGWMAFRLVGADIDLPAALAIEALLHVALAAAFLVPGSVGVQEVAYVALGAIFGVPPELCLGASLIRRARDLALGVPVLLIWQLVEVRRLRANR